jgi:two-component system sensor histidine kinase PilS (NtrC family)
MVKKITFFIVGRLLLVTLFLSIGALVLKIDRSFFYLLIAIVYFLSLIYLIWLLQKKYLKTLVVIQIILDCLLETLIVLNTGGMNSVFIILYCLTILSASIVVSPVIGMFTTGMASFLYLAQLYCAFYNVFPSFNFPRVKADFSLMLFTAHVNVVTFILIGVLSAFLARQLSQMRKKIREKEQTSLMGELAAQIAHEIRNPLATISGSIELLEEELSDKLEAKDANLMKAIVSESERVSGIFEQFLDLSKLDKMTVSRIFLNDLLHEIVFLLSSSGVLKKIKVIDQFSANAYSFSGDTNRIKQVFWNIIRNAIDAMPHGGELIIKTSQNADNVFIVFSDTGTGINAKKQRELFVPFCSTKKGGSGLGLVIAHKIIERHAGKIEVQSEINKGTTFTIVLPKEFISE